MTWRFKSPILFITLLFGTTLYAQYSGGFRSVTVDDGLAQNSVWDMLQDRAGYYWFATADGLNKYDGEKFVHYKRLAGKPFTISGNTVGKLFLDSKDRVWAMHNEGVSVYNRALDRFDIHLDAKILGESSRGIWIMKSDTFKLLDPQTLEIIHFTVVEIPEIKTHAITSRYIQFNGCFYVAGKGGIEVFNTTDDTFRILDTPLDFGGAFLALNDSIIFCPGLRSVSYLLNIKTNQFREIHIEVEKEATFYPTDLQWHNGRILMSSPLGLYIISPETMKVVKHLKSFESNEGTSYKFVESIFVDRNNTLFLGTNGNGLKIYSPFKNRFDTYSTKNAALDMVKSICLLENGNLVAGVYDNELVIYSDFNTYRQVEIGSSNSQKSVLGMAKYDDYRIMGINGKELFLFNTQSNSKEFRLKIDSINVSYPNFIASDSCWYFNTNRAIYRLSPQLELEELYRAPDDIDYINSFLLKGKRIYVGTNKELFIVEDSQIIKRSVLSVYMKSVSLKGDTVFAATQSGLFLMTLDGELIDKHDVSTGLNNDFLYGILEDDFGYVWVSHNKGITRIDLKTGTYLQFDVSDGLQSNEFNTGAFYKHSDGKLYFGGVSGINMIDPENLLLDSTQSQISLNEINLFDQALEADTAYNEIKSLTLSYLQNTLSFDYAVLDYSQPENIVYACMMEGFDQNWIVSGNRHYARYANLPAGKYTFKMKAANGDGVWMDEPKSIAIEIIPPYWQTVWFKMLMVIVGLLVLVLIVATLLARQRTKLRRKLEVQHQLEMERVRISRDLHDNVGAQLSFLITNMEWIADHPDSLDSSERKEQLKQLSDTGRQAITTLRQTIWAISQNELSVDDFADRFKQFALKMVELLPDIKLHFEENIAEHKMLSPAIALNLFRIAQEAFNNAIKHSNATNFFINFQSNASIGFQFEIKDNGQGFDQNLSAPNGHYGLSNMKARASESNAVLEIDSQINRGTIIRLTWCEVVNNAYAV